jgi:hypothetical protein
MPCRSWTINSSRAQITGNFTSREASALGGALNNPLDAPHRVVDEQKF